jgi:predicted RNA-binding Zn ribbon-like protein
VSFHPDFVLLGEPLALDLVNTRVCRGGEVVDLLDTTRALAAWLRAERPRVAWVGKATAADLRAVRALRTTIDDLLRALREHARPASATVDAINRAFSRPHPGAQLTWPASGPRMTPSPSGTRCDRVLQLLAADAVQLLTGRRAAHIRQCAHPDCRLQFLALNPRRRWCSGTLCGNRARVARHYLKQHRAS